MTLRIFAITKPGMGALSLAVAALWTCVGLETAIRHQTARDTAALIQTLTRLRHLKHDSEVIPASQSGPRFVPPQHSIS
jgi:hypothetical protein